VTGEAGSAAGGGKDEGRPGGGPNPDVTARRKQIASPKVGRRLCCTVCHSRPCSAMHGLLFRVKQGKVRPVTLVAPRDCSDWPNVIWNMMCPDQIHER